MIMHWNRFLVGLNLALDALALSVQMTDCV